MEWWDALKYIIDMVQPIYKFLNFADQDKKPNICESHDGLPDYETGPAVFLWNKCFHTKGVYSGGGREVR